MTALGKNADSKHFFIDVIMIIAANLNDTTSRKEKKREEESDDGKLALNSEKVRGLQTPLH